MWTSKNKHTQKDYYLLVLGVILMVFAYSQSPLYTSNQNQYFLHGMAESGLGSLNQDWLASTKEPTPAFTFLVKWTFLLLKSEVWFYFYYAVLIGVYFLSLLGILNQVFNIRESKPKFLLAISLIIFSHSAGFRYFLTKSLGPEWDFIFDGGVAGQRLLGTVFQPSTFGVLMIFSLLLFINNRPFFSAILAAVTADIHPTYLLTAALLVGGYILTSYYENKEFKKPFLIGLCSLTAVFPILIYIFINFWGGNESAEAYRILTQIRIPHHAIISEWFNITSLIKIAVIIWGLSIIRKRPRIFIPLSTVFLFSLTLSFIQYFIESNFLALVFPWRPSALLVPICSAIIFGKIASCVCDTHRNPKSEKLIIILSISLSIILAVLGIFRTTLLLEKKINSPESELFAWVKETSNDSDKYLIPVGLETFRTSTARPVYVDFFAIPYRNEDVIQWYHRVLSANKYYQDGECEELAFIRNDAKITYIITEKEKIQPDCKSYELAFQGDHYLAYKFKE
ncbi:MAG: hypothetical protein J7K66_00170 [Anaerolineaceae bacterium]|nr:hypothetical protein [Anaerolineaceae bacterium]